MKITIGIIISFLLLSMGSCTTANDQAQKQKEHFSGTLLISVADDFKRGRAEYHYSLELDRDGTIIPLIFRDPGKLRRAEPNSRIEIFGLRTKDGIHVEHFRFIDPGQK